MRAPRLAEQQRRAYPDVSPLIVGLQADAAFTRALEIAQQMGWTIVASDKSAAEAKRAKKPLDGLY